METPSTKLEGNLLLHDKLPPPTRTTKAFNKGFFSSPSL